MARLTIATSNLNMPPRLAVLGGLSAHEDFLDEAGYGKSAAGYVGGGFEWSEVHNPHSLIRARLGWQLAAIKRIGSLHQSWRSTRVADIAVRIFHPGGEWNGVRNTLGNVAKGLGLAATVPFI